MIGHGMVHKTRTLPLRQRLGDDFCCSAGVSACGSGRNWRLALMLLNLPDAFGLTWESFARFCTI